MAARRLRPVARIRATVERLRAVRGVAEITDPVTMPARELAAGDGCAGSAPRARHRD
jgi:hypothetical protein